MGQFLYIFDELNCGFMSHNCKRVILFSQGGRSLPQIRHYQARNYIEAKEAFASLKFWKIARKFWIKKNCIILFYLLRSPVLVSRTLPINLLVPVLRDDQFHRREHYKKVTISNILHLKASNMHQIITKISKKFSIWDGAQPPSLNPTPFCGKNKLFVFASLFLNPGYGPDYSEVD